MEEGGVGGPSCVTDLYTCFSDKAAELKSVTSLQLW